MRALGVNPAALCVLSAALSLCAAFAVSQVKPLSKSTARSSSTKPLIAPRSDYAGEATCASCHQQVAAGYRKTAHHLTSQPANKDTIVGDFLQDHNTMATANANLTFRMDRRGDEFFQTAIWGASDSASAPGITSTDSPAQGPAPSTAARTRTERLELVIGSGGKGQNYLFWRNDELFQLPSATPPFSTTGSTVPVTAMAPPISIAPSFRAAWNVTPDISIPLFLAPIPIFTTPRTTSWASPANAATDLVASTSKPINNL